MSGFKMQADGERGEIWIFGRIGEFFFDDGVTSDAFIKDLRDLGEVSELVVHINSPGGQVHEGQAIYNALKDHPAAVITSIEGAAWSAASMIAMAGDTIRMHANSTLMIHEPMNGAFGFAADLRKVADDLEQLRDVTLDVYAERSGADRDEVAGWMKEEKRFTPQQAKEAGFADEIVPNKRGAKTKTANQSATRPAVNWSDKLKGLGVRGLPRVAVALSEFEPTSEEETMADSKPTSESKPEADSENQPAEANANPPDNKPPEKPAEPSAPVAQQQPSADDVRATERKRISSITAVCEMAKIEPAKRQKWIDEGMSVEDVTLEARKQMAASNPAPEAAGGEPDKDPDSKYRDEFRKRDAKLAAMSDLSEDEYIASRRIDDGLEPLIPTRPAKKSA